MYMILVPLPFTISSLSEMKCHQTIEQAEKSNYACVRVSEELGIADCVTGSPTLSGTA